MSQISPGDKVAVHTNYSVVERRVAKVYKNGNFTLVDDKVNQQWRRTYPERNKDRWVAWPTGVDFPHEHVTAWDDETEKKIADDLLRRSAKSAVTALEYALGQRRTNNGDYNLTEAEVEAVRTFTRTLEK